MSKLTDRKCQTAAPGRHGDGTVKGLYLIVTRAGTRNWVLRYQMAHRRRDMGLGKYPEITLSRARERAMEARRLVAERIDPLAARSRVSTLTFRTAAEALIESKRPGWRNAKHAEQWPSTLRAYVYPKLGELAVGSIDTPTVMDVLKPIWTSKPETASRVRQRIEAVLDYAATMGARTGDNPARWRGHLEHLLAAPSKVKRVEHHPALPWREAPAFMADLAKRDSVAARALAFTILTAARSGEVRGMTWGEVDLDNGVWTIPGARMKAGKEHRVPLVPEALALLGEPGQSAALVFPSPSKPGRPLSDMTLTAVLKRMDRADLTAHGFRSTFRDWAGEASPFPREVLEAALAHRLKDKVEAAYARGDLFTKRRKLMEAWGAFLLRPATADVVPMHRPTDRAGATS